MQAIVVTTVFTRGLVLYNCKQSQLLPSGSKWVELQNVMFVIRESGWPVPWEGASMRYKLRRRTDGLIAVVSTYSFGNFPYHCTCFLILVVSASYLVLSTERNQSSWWHVVDIHYFPSNSPYCGICWVINILRVLPVRAAENEKSTETFCLARSDKNLPFSIMFIPTHLPHSQQQAHYYISQPTMFITQRQSSYGSQSNHPIFNQISIGSDFLTSGVDLSSTLSWTFITWYQRVIHIMCWAYSSRFLSWGVPSSIMICRISPANWI